MGNLLVKRGLVFGFGVWKGMRGWGVMVGCKEDAEEMGRGNGNEKPRVLSDTGPTNTRTFTQFLEVTRSGLYYGDPPGVVKGYGVEEEISLLVV